MVGKIQKWNDGKTRMANIPLYLTGDPFSVWSEMTTSDHDDEEKVKERLQESFSMLSGEAYSQFVRRRKRGDETVDAYLSDLRRMMRVSGHKEATDGKDPMLLKQFLVGLPSQYASQLRLSMAASSSGLTVSAVATQAGALCASGLVQTSEVAAVASQAASLVCYQCQLTGHLRKDCPQNASGGARKKMRSYHCNQVGHLRRNCPQRSKSSETTSSGSVLAQFSKGIMLPQVPDCPGSRSRTWYVYTAGCC